jgi:hypothetical protein
MQKTTKNAVAEMVQREVKTQLRRYAMARTREEFINALVDELAPALAHHYRALLDEANERTAQVAKWRDQEDKFFEEFAIQLLKPTKAKALNVRRAVEQAVKELLQKDDARRRIETLTFQKAHKLKNVTPLPEDARAEFLQRVWEIVDAVYPE